MPDSRVPDRYRHSVIPHVMIRGAADAIAFYERAFGATELFRIAHPSGAILHAEIQIGASLVMIGDPESPFCDPRTAGCSTVGLHVYVDDVDALVAQAIGAGAKELQPVQDMFYGDRTGMIEDPFGHVWVFLTHIEDLPPEEIQRRGEAILSADAP